MDTVTLTINVPKNIGGMLEARAKADGKEVSEYVETLIERDIDRRKLLDEVLAPVRASFAEHDISEDELDALIESERQAIWDEKTSNRR